MAEHEDAAIPFLKPILAQKFTGTLTSEQRAILAKWIFLVAILQELKAHTRKAIPKVALHNFKEKGEIPQEAAIYIGKTIGPDWRYNYQYHNFPISARFENQAFPSQPQIGISTQVTTMGIGPLFCHLFFCPNQEGFQLLENHSRRHNLIKLYPTYGNGNSITFPLIKEVSDKEADNIESECLVLVKNLLYYGNFLSLHG